jgi:hypothetical protein
MSCLLTMPPDNAFELCCFLVCIVQSRARRCFEIDDELARIRSGKEGQLTTHLQSSSCRLYAV